MANLSKITKRNAPLNRSLRTLLLAYLEEMLAMYLRGAREVRVRQGAEVWSYLLFECDIATALDLAEYHPPITEELIDFFEKHGLEAVCQQGLSKYFLITINLAKLNGLHTEQLCLEY